MADGTEVPDHWKCPKCGASPNGHGKGDCTSHMDGACAGFICECDNDEPGDGHGTPEDPCPEAVCYHCGWAGEFPPPPFNPSKLKGWAKQAWAAGWRPPRGWMP